MIITVVTDVLGKENNGTTIAAMNLIRYLRSRGHEVRVICPDQNRIGEPGFSVVPVRDFGPLNTFIKANGVQLASPDPGIIRTAIAGSDVVHIMLPFKLGRAAEKIAAELRIPCTAGFHMMAENLTAHLSLKDFQFLNRQVYRYLSSFYDHCFAIHYPTAFLRHLYEQIEGPTNGYVISNGVNSCFRPMSVTRPGILKDKIVILYTGRYSREKTHSILIDGVNLSRYRDRIQLVFAGSGPRKSEIERHARILPIQPIFRFFSRNDMLRIINCADLYVHPAEIEAEGISCLEAIACGLVPIISDSPRSATKEYALSDKNLFRYNEPQDLADKIDWWIEHPEEKEACSAEYIRYSADRFDQDLCMKKMEDMLFDARDGIVRHAAKTSEKKPLSAHSDT